MKNLPFNQKTIQNVITNYPTPFHMYDEAGIRRSSRKLIDAFSWSPNFKNFYAVKALPNPEILKIVVSEGMGLDCSSLAELVLAEKIGVNGNQIMFTSNNTTAQEYKKAAELGAIINLDDISHIQYLEDCIGKLPDTLSFRFKPGSERVGNSIIGNPSEAKYGLTRKQIFQAYKISKEKGVRHFGIHTMVASNELDPNYFIETAKMMFEIAADLYDKYDISLDFINMGGGLGIPYEPRQKDLDVQIVSNGVKKLYEKMLSSKGISPDLFYECGRFVTGPHGYLISTVLHLKHTYRDYIGLDASMTDLMRPAMYGAYHHITVLGKQNDKVTDVYDVTGSLCENNDKFAVQRQLPKIEIDDVFVIHDTGAHGHAMGFNYNGKLRSAELLLTKMGDVRLIRRAETLDDYFATLEF